MNALDDGLEISLKCRIKSVAASEWESRPGEMQYREYMEEHYPLRLYNLEEPQNCREWRESSFPKAGPTELII